MSVLASDPGVQAAPAYKGRSRNDHPVTGVRCISVSKILNDTSPKFLQAFDIRQISDAICDGRLEVQDRAAVEAVIRRSVAESTNEGRAPDPDVVAQMIVEADTARPLDDLREDMKQILRTAAGAEIGTIAHSHIEHGTPLNDIEDDRVRGMVSAGRDWIDSSGCELVAHEMQVWGDDFQGRVDALARTPEGELVVVDWKTTLGEDLSIYPDAQTQVAAYCDAAPFPDGWPGGDPPRRGVVVRMNAAGDHHALEVDCSEDSAARQIWSVMKEYAYAKTGLEVSRPPEAD